MHIEPLSLEQQLRVESLKRQLKDLSHEELLEYAERMVVVTAKLTHQTKQLLRHIVEIELDSTG